MCLINIDNMTIWYVDIPDVIAGYGRLSDIQITVDKENEKNVLEAYRVTPREYPPYRQNFMNCQTTSYGLKFVKIQDLNECLKPKK